MSYEVTYTEIFKGKKYNMSIVIQPWQTEKTIKKIKQQKNTSNIEVKIYIPENE